MYLTFGKTQKSSTDALALRMRRNEQPMHLRALRRNGADNFIAAQGNETFASLYAGQNTLLRMKIVKGGDNFLRIMPRIAFVDRAGYEGKNLLSISAARFPYLKFTHLFVFKMDINTSDGTSTEPMLRMRFLPSFCFSSNFFLRVISPP